LTVRGTVNPTLVAAKLTEGEDSPTLRE